ncbi:multifunctional CCA tRNA nucleotidyl transferase/2'3'-cyclic phosphodiesterase/2'nucleotidase/phosphatase [Janthinobacterium sp. SUN118]|uniref:multifunctional CCA tRNA nucleotidyl transferase/2'3'-cyclic phosphodiesterase/2'nucleotidase/phosphatase n=1 Tax=Janthinobacterium sp. SUN118 TaxID=3004100 RepID=UPI0025AF91E3|nr:multifunctional CCA tRNA nucleotidyl transferase/2'3'-cyclic phosphodiesterase/2'nucleotidase/phosphatase [Janthinobacterium sp. SUN118]MDN2711188.1 multifunctional CCA tRNA nucleotidyl transferase/2'3'-cyclic phosphodiesterase/2'nucleotidase/phosphatase [Janthinobacterium sp. SUN118]
MKIYTVGGAVRDQLLGLPIKDRDYVVVGATPEDMLRRGFRPVGKDFPVFLHPQTQEEYALARTERKTAPGYRGFVFHTAPDVTLEDDLVRRDLTINAIAMAEDGSLTDPFGGVADIENKVFRHVSGAFGEDPVRILRLARFAARYDAFTVAPATMDLMRRMVADGEVDALVAERVWQEVAKGLMEARPSRMLTVLQDCGALARIMGEITIGARLLQVIDHAAAQGVDLPVRFAALMLHMRKDAIEQLSERLRVPNECRELAVMAARERDNINGALDLSAEAIVSLCERCDGLRKPQRYAQMLQAVACDGLVAGDFAPAVRLQGGLDAARAVNAGALAQGCTDPKRIPEVIHAARVAAVAAFLAQA